MYALLSVVNSYHVSKYSSSVTKSKQQRQERQQFELHFKKKDDSSNGNEDAPSLLQRIKRFLPWNRRVEIDKTYAETVSSTGMRYHLRLLNPKDINQRHIITRIQRYFPDITWETAENIVAQAINEDAALLRVLNSKV